MVKKVLLSLLLTLCLTGIFAQETKSVGYSIMGYELPNLPYFLIGIGLTYLLIVVKLFIERDDLFDEDNRRRIPFSLGLLFFLVYGLMEAGYIGTELIPINPPSLILAIGSIFLLLAGLFDMTIV